MNMNIGRRKPGGGTLVLVGGNQGDDWTVVVGQLLVLDLAGSYLSFHLSIYLFISISSSESMYLYIFF